MQRSKRPRSTSINHEAEASAPGFAAAGPTRWSASQATSSASFSRSGNPLSISVRQVVRDQFVAAE